MALRHGAEGEVLDIGRRTRAVPTALRRALQDRDRSQCQFPGCNSRRCDAHHVVHWADGGETRLQNLVLCCRFHHRAVHEEGFQVVADADGQFRFLRPDGVPLSAEPPAVCWEGEPLAPTDARLATAGVSIGPHTATPDWYGESLDLTAALEVLWQPPARAAPARRGAWRSLTEPPARRCGGWLAVFGNPGGRTYTIATGGFASDQESSRGGQHSRFPRTRGDRPGVEVETDRLYLVPPHTRG